MKHTVILSVVCLAVVIGGWYFVVGRSAEARIERLEKSIGAECKKMEAYREALIRFDDRIREYNRVHSTINSQAMTFSGKDEVIALYRDLDSLCHLPGYRLDEITPSVEEVIQFLREWARSDSTITIPIRIKIDANYRSLAELVEAVEESKYFNHLESCRIYGSEELYPRCALDVTFIAGLSNRLEMFDLE